MKKSITNIPNEIVSKNILKIVLEDFSIFGSIAFYITAMLTVWFIGNQELFLRLLYAFLIGIVIIVIIRGGYHKDRPQKEEFDIFMERVIASSFPSSHSLFVTMLVVLLSIAYPRTGMIIISSIVALLVYLQRYITRKHFIMDIFGGILIAIIILVFVIRVL
jgi:membrane-associated phospholipid phosphatase